MTTMPTAFSEHEKRFLLAEIIKTSPVSLDSLIRIVREENIQPNWNEIFLPTARNVNACRAAFSELISSSPASFQHPGPYDKATPPIQSKKRRHSDAEQSIPSNIRTLKPKPAENGEQSGTFRSSSGNAPKKRGRPSKEELAQRQADAKARGEVYPPLKQARKSTGSAAPAIPVTFLVSAAGSAGPIEPPTAVPAPEAPGSGKKKRGRPSIAEKEETAKAIAEAPPGTSGAPGHEIGHTPNTTDIAEAGHTEILPEIPTASMAAEIPDSAASTNTLFVASGPI